MQIINLLFDFALSQIKKQNKKYTRGIRSRMEDEKKKNKTLDRNNKQNLICFSLHSLFLPCFPSISMSKTSLACASKVENRNENTRNNNMANWVTC